MSDAERPVMMLKLGPLTITGPWALVALVVIVTGVVALVIHERPSLEVRASGALWILFLAYWSVAAKNSAPAARSESPASRQWHQLMLNAALLLLFLPVPFLTTRWLPAGRSVALAGLALESLSLALAVWSRRHLGRNWSGAVTAKVDHQLVQSGPYRVVRHPIYTAMLGMALGTAVVSGSVHALIGFVLMAIAYARKMPMEDRILSETFGADYDAYRRKSWAIVPFIV